MCTLTAAVGGALGGYRALSSVMMHKGASSIAKNQEALDQAQLNNDIAHKDDGVLAVGQDAMSRQCDLLSQAATSGIAQDGTFSDMMHDNQDRGLSEENNAMDDAYHKIAQDHMAITQDDNTADQQNTLALTSLVEGAGDVAGRVARGVDASSAEDDKNWASNQNAQYSKTMGIPEDIGGRSDMPYNHPYLNYAYQSYGGCKPSLSPIAASIYDDYTPTRYSKSGVRSDFDMPTF